jgi:exoribonuclease R
MEPDVEIDNPRASQFAKYAEGMWRVAYITKHETRCPSAFITAVDPDGAYIQVTNGKRHWRIHPAFLSKIQFFAKK